jgi:MraZ protein
MSKLPKQAKTGENPSGADEDSQGGGDGAAGAGGGAARGAAGGDERILYQGEFEHGVDEKRRIQVPAKWRPMDTENVELTLILWPQGTQADACLLVLPPKETETLVENIRTTPFANVKAEVLRRLIGSKSENVKFDRAGRICIPERMAKAAQVEKEAMLVGMMDRFQIWNVERYRTVKSADELMLQQAFEVIATRQT